MQKQFVNLNFLLFSTVCDMNDLLNSQKHGECTDATGFRFLASINWKGTRFCSGTFVHDKFVLTTGRCIWIIRSYNEPDNYTNLTVFFSITVFDIIETNYFKDYIPNTKSTNHYNNLGIIRVYKFVD